MAHPPGHTEVPGTHVAAPSWLARDPGRTGRPGRRRLRNAVPPPAARAGSGGSKSGVERALGRGRARGVRRRGVVAACAPWARSASGGPPCAGVLLGVAGGLLAFLVPPGERARLRRRSAAGELSGRLHRRGQRRTVVGALVAALPRRPHPLGEELAFRGVVTTALLRYGALVGVVGSALIFAVMHGINVVFVAALIAGLITAELRRRSGRSGRASPCTPSTTLSSR
jgi:membrane protease YdiL (CAAX protease family)